MAATTREFGAINERVRGAEARLKNELGRPDLAGRLRAVQEAERTKLHFTLIQQACQSSHDALYACSPEVARCGRDDSHEAWGSTGAAGEGSSRRLQLAAQ